MFFLRCAFWLSIVYASMSWTAGQFGVADTQRDGRHASEHLLQAAVGTAAAYCSRHTAECLADAARLTSLARQVGDLDPPSAQTAEPRQATAQWPRPIPDPRRP